MTNQTTITVTSFSSGRSPIKTAVTGNPKLFAIDVLPDDDDDALPDIFNLVPVIKLNRQGQ